jgi:hypothetical protein
MTSAIRVAAACLCLLGAAFFALLALDAHAWSSRLPADDLRYRHDASAHALWRADEFLPGGVGRQVLGIDDDLAYRRALRDFRLGRPIDPVAGTSITTHRVRAQIELTAVAESGASGVRRSQVENLLGVLGFGLGSQDVGQRTTFFNNAVAAFRRSVVLDPSDDDAFFNLEYALDQLRSGGEQQSPGSARSGHQGQAGLSPPGQGY